MAGRLALAAAALASLVALAAQADAGGEGVAYLDSGVAVLYAFPDYGVPKGSVGDGVHAAIASDTSGNLVIPPSLGGFALTNVANLAFSSCAALTSVTLPEGVARVGSGAFSSCTSLTHLSLPDSLLTIGSDAFSACSSLETVELPDGLASLGGGAFQACRSLTTITLPRGVTRLAATTFLNCTALASVALPDGLTTIARAAFQNCTALRGLVIPRTVATLGADVFKGCDASLVVLAPSALRGDGSLGGVGTVFFYGAGEPLDIRADGSFAVASADALAAVLAAVASPTIRLTADLTDTAVIPDTSRAVVLDLNGHTLAGADGTAVVVAGRDTALTILGRGTLAGEVVAPDDAAAVPLVATTVTRRGGTAAGVRAAEVVGFGARADGTWEVVCDALLTADTAADAGAFDVSRLRVVSAPTLAALADADDATRREADAVVEERCSAVRLRLAIPAGPSPRFLQLVIDNN